MTLWHCRRNQHYVTRGSSLAELPHAPPCQPFEALTLVQQLVLGWSAGPPPQNCQEQQRTQLEKQLDEAGAVAYLQKVTPRHHFKAEVLGQR
mmetsp:Transcript_70944/g.122991  ORF Transcript_70944/g.122991 Transcript_70944/m.122991 type:complete len:92 (+) Transcript_70944:501-776(+)